MRNDQVIYIVHLNIGFIELVNFHFPFHFVFFVQLILTLKASTQIEKKFYNNRPFAVGTQEIHPILKWLLWESKKVFWFFVVLFYRQIEECFFFSFCLFSCEKTIKLESTWNLHSRYILRGECKSGAE